MKKSHIWIITIESFLLAVAAGLGVWWYVHNNVVRTVEKVFEDGSSYKGEWLAGQMHGQGIYIMADGEVYEGEFINGRRDGKGKVKMSDGAEYEGLWKDSKYHGEGKYISPKGNIYEGVWRYGQLREGRLTNESWVYEGEIDAMSPS
jgi:hypothetical protein